MSHEDVDDNFLRQRRQELGLSQNQVARDLGISCQAVWMWEHDRVLPSWTRLGELVRVYKCESPVLIEWMSKQATRLALAKSAADS